MKLAMDKSAMDRRTLLCLRIIHLLCLVTIPAAMLILFLVLPRGDPMNTWNATIESGAVTTMFLYVLCIFNAILAWKWPNRARFFGTVSRIYSIEDDSPEFAVAVSHLGRILECSETTVVFAFVLGLIGTNWYLVMPLFVLAFVELLLIYPTDKKWAKWVSQRPESATE